MLLTRQDMVWFSDGRILWLLISRWLWWWSARTGSFVRYDPQPWHWSLIGGNRQLQVSDIQRSCLSSMLNESNLVCASSHPEGCGMNGEKKLVKKMCIVDAAFVRVLCIGTCVVIWGLFAIYIWYYFDIIFCYIWSPAHSSQKSVRSIWIDKSLVFSVAEAILGW